jgi:2-polyprenyl-3-methyl-5-hydroxy-6-metoxy-1,4-benzoquinol methylase
MSIEPFSEPKIIDSWHKNAAPWIVAIAERQIVSRNLVTDRAIVDTIVECGKKHVLDLGCGEGWLTRELTARGMQVVGVDVVPALIERAKLNCNARFLELTYAEIAAGKLTDKFDLVVANFSLIGDESVTGLFEAMRAILTPDGIFVIQTMHPVIAGGDEPYIDDWRVGSWAGFSNEFSDPAPWYFRTIATWVNLYVSHGLSLVEIREPIHPQTCKPASLILVGKLRDRI